MARVKRVAYFDELGEQMSELKDEIKMKQKTLAAHKKGEGLSPVTLSGNKLSETDSGELEQWS